jgi:excinuclease ABC subunit C
LKKQTDNRSRLTAKVEELPRSPGIYFFKDAKGKVIYIGKARSLQDRVRSYFQPTSDPKVRNILRETADIDYLLTETEKDAVFLESNYVRNAQPKFNLRLKDDKSFPYLKLTVQDEFPGVYFTRKVADDGARYFGPFAPPSRARRTIQIINTYFGVRGCVEKIPGKRRRPCLDHEIGLCSAPCVAALSAQHYRESVRHALLLLEGRTDELKASLTRKMEEAAAREEFELAAWWRDALRAVEDVKTGPRLISPIRSDLDIVGFDREGTTAALMVFLMRKGKVLESKPFVIAAAPDREPAGILGEFLLDYYKNVPLTAGEILVPFEPSPGGKGRLPLVVPKKGRKKQLIDFADRNARLLLTERSAPSSGIDELGNVLGLKGPLRRIEGFDISNTGGTESVGSLVVFEDGRPKKSEYRKFKVKTVEGPNDVAGLREVIARRYRRSLEEGTTLPDLVFVDGGKPQRGSALKTLRDLGLDGIPVASLAKKEEIIFSEADRDGLRLDRTSPALKLLQRIRDEAHRFAVTFHRKRREKRMLGR